MSSPENIDKKNPESNLDNKLDNKENLENSFKDLKQSLNKLKNEIKELHETNQEKKDIKKLDQEIDNIDKQIKIEREVEKYREEWKLNPKQEIALSKQMKNISQRLKNNPWDSNEWRADSAFTLLNEIYSSDPNPISNSMLKIIRFILDL